MLAIGAQAVTVTVAGEGEARGPGGAAVAAGVERDRRRALREGLVLQEVDDAVELGEAVRRQRAVGAERQDVAPGDAVIGRARDDVAARLLGVGEQRAVGRARS